MEVFVYEQLEFSPRVVCDPFSGKIVIEGESSPENVNEFYEKILVWVDSYISYIKKINNFSSKKKTLELNLKITYFNSPSHKYIYLILKKIDDNRKLFESIVLKWFYADRDDEMLESGNEFKEMFNLPILLIPY